MNARKILRDFALCGGGAVAGALVSVTLMTSFSATPAALVAPSQQAAASPPAAAVEQRAEEAAPRAPAESDLEARLWAIKERARQIRQ